MPSIGKNGQAGNLVTARYFQSKHTGPKPLLIILPLWGVDTLPSTELARHVTRNGGGSINVLQLHGHHRLFDMEKTALAWTPDEFLSLIDEMANRITNTVIDIRRIVDWAETQPGIDRHRIALVGFSLSAMVASLALSNEPRLGAGVLVMGSASPHESFATCGGAAGEMREMVTTRFGWSDDQYRSMIKDPLARVDPARFAGRVDPRRILIIEAGKDTCLPASARRQLWEAMGRPERIVYQYDHRMSFLAMTVLGGRSLQKEALRFLRKVFDLNEAG
jgi:dienelactone hydrolase